MHQMKRFSQHYISCSANQSRALTATINALKAIQFYEVKALKAQLFQKMKTKPQSKTVLKSSP